MEPLSWKPRQITLDDINQMFHPDEKQRLNPLAGDIVDIVDEWVQTISDVPIEECSLKDKIAVSPEVIDFLAVMTMAWSRHFTSNMSGDGSKSD